MIQLITRATHCLLLLVVMSLSGCYDVPYLIKPESDGVIEDLALGTWVSRKDTPLAHGVKLEITRTQNSPWYDAVRTDLTTGEKRFIRAIAHSIGERLILSYQDDRDKDYSIFSLHFEETSGKRVMKAIALNEGAPRFKTKEQFLTFLESDQADPWFKEGYVFDQVGRS